LTDFEISCLTRLAKNQVGTGGKYQCLELYLDKVINLGKGYPRHSKKSHKMDMLPTNPEEGEEVTEQIELQEGDVIIRATGANTGSMENMRSPVCQTFKFRAQILCLSLTRWEI
jgi:hypothetical protein